MNSSSSISSFSSCCLISWRFCSFSLCNFMQNGKTHATAFWKWTHGQRFTTWSTTLLGLKMHGHNQKHTLKWLSWETKINKQTCHYSISQKQDVSKKKTESEGKNRDHSRTIFRFRFYTIFFTAYESPKPEKNLLLTGLHCPNDQSEITAPFSLVFLALHVRFSYLTPHAWSHLKGQVIFGKAGLEQSDMSNYQWKWLWGTSNAKMRDMGWKWGRVLNKGASCPCPSPPSLSLSRSLSLTHTHTHTHTHTVLFVSPLQFSHAPYFPLPTSQRVFPQWRAKDECSSSTGTCHVYWSSDYNNHSLVAYSSPDIECTQCLAISDLGQSSESSFCSFFKDGEMLYM